MHVFSPACRARSLILNAQAASVALLVLSVALAQPARAQPAAESSSAQPPPAAAPEGPLGALAEAGASTTPQGPAPGAHAPGANAPGAGASRRASFWGFSSQILRPVDVGASGLLNPVFGVPALVGSETVGTDRLMYATRFVLNTLSVDERKPASEAQLSGAFVRFTQALTYGLGDDWDVTLTLPLIARVGTTRIVENGTPLIDTQSGRFALGEITLSTRWRLLRVENQYPFRGIVARLDLKLPFDPPNGTLAASGEPDLTGMIAVAIGEEDWLSQLGFGFTYLGLGSPNERIFNSSKDLENIWFVGLNLAVHLTNLGDDRWPLVALFQAHLYGSPFLDVSEVLGGTFGDLLLGLRAGFNGVDVTLSAGETVSHFTIDAVVFIEVAWTFDFGD